MIFRYRLQIHVTDETEFILSLLWNKEALQLSGKTVKELTEGLIGDADVFIQVNLMIWLKENSCLMFRLRIQTLTRMMMFIR